MNDRDVINTLYGGNIKPELNNIPAPTVNGKPIQTGRSKSYLVNSYEEVFTTQWEEGDIITAKVPTPVEVQHAIKANIYSINESGNIWYYFNIDKLKVNVDNPKQSSYGGGANIKFCVKYHNVIVDVNNYLSGSISGSYTSTSISIRIVLSDKIHNTTKDYTYTQRSFDFSMFTTFIHTCLDDIFDDNNYEIYIAQCWSPYIQEYNGKFLYEKHSKLTEDGNNYALKSSEVEYYTASSQHPYHFIKFDNKFEFDKKTAIYDKYFVLCIEDNNTKYKRIIELNYNNKDFEIHLELASYRQYYGCTINGKQYSIEELKPYIFKHVIPYYIDKYKLTNNVTVYFGYSSEYTNIFNYDGVDFINLDDNALTLLSPTFKEQDAIYEIKNTSNSFLILRNSIKLLNTDLPNLGFIDNRINQNYILGYDDCPIEYDYFSFIKWYYNNINNINCLYKLQLLQHQLQYNVGESSADTPCILIFSNSKTSINVKRVTYGNLGTTGTSYFSVDLNTFLIYK